MSMPNHTGPSLTMTISYRHETHYAVLRCNVLFLPCGLLCTVNIAYSHHYENVEMTGPVRLFAGRTDSNYFTSLCSSMPWTTPL